MYRYLASEGRKRMWILSFMGETWINHCVHALHTSCLTPEEHFAYFQLEKHFFKRKRMLQLRVAKVWMLADGPPER